MFRRKLCPHCKTGKYTYELDRHSLECPYLACHNGRKCAMYEKLDEPKKRSFLSRIFNKASVHSSEKSYSRILLVIKSTPSLASFSASALLSHVQQLILIPFDLSSFTSFLSSAI